MISVRRRRDAVARTLKLSSVDTFGLAQFLMGMVGLDFFFVPADSREQLFYFLFYVVSKRPFSSEIGRICRKSNRIGLECIFITTELMSTSLLLLLWRHDGDGKRIHSTLVVVVAVPFFSILLLVLQKFQQ